MNEAALQDVLDADHDSVSGLPLDVAVPMAAMLGVPEALQAAAETGAPQHLQADLVSTARGSVAIVTSLYPVPGGNVLLLMEHAWQAGREGGRIHHGTLGWPRALVGRCERSASREPPQRTALSDLKHRA